MAERQETSVMASIQDILRDAQLREEQDKVAAQRRVEAEEQARVDAIRRQQEDEEARMRADEEERQRREFEERRKSAELQAMHEAAVQRAKMEAEAQARLAEMNARQDHERQLNALKHDKGKKMLKWGVISAVLFLVIGGSVLGYALKVQSDKNEAAQAELRKLNDEKVAVESERTRIEIELKNTKDPEKIKQLEQEKKNMEAKIDGLNADLVKRGKDPGPSAVTRPAGFTGGGGGNAPAAPVAAPPPCRKGDPLCSGI